MEFIERAELESMIRRAYQEGFLGYLGMMEECVGRMVEEFMASRKSSPSPSFTFTTNMNLNENVVAPYYLYSTTTTAPPEIGRRDEVV